MKFQNSKKSILAQYKVSNKVVVMLEGAPGSGKSACVREVGDDLAEFLMKKHGVKNVPVVEFNPSLRDPVDIMGIPFKSQDGTHSEWLPPTEFYNLRDGVGPCILILEELTDACINMQNPLCRIILDRYAGQLKLSDDLYILATGNRVQDRSGAQRLSTKLGNRMRIINFDYDLDEWVDWAFKNNINKNIIRFLQFRPSLFNKFDPTKSINATPRSWVAVSEIPFDEIEKMDPSLDLLTEMVAGDVGDGPSNEFTSYLKIFNKLPNLEKVKVDPLKVEVPVDLSIIYATIMKCVDLVDSKNTIEEFDNILTYVLQFKKNNPDFIISFIKEMVQNQDKCKIFLKMYRESKEAKKLVKTMQDLGIKSGDVFGKNNSNNP